MHCTDRLLGNSLCPVADQRLPGPAACRALVPPEESDLDVLRGDARRPATWSRHGLRLGPPACRAPGRGDMEKGRREGGERERRWRWGKPGGRPKPSYRRGAGSLRAKRKVCGDDEESASRDGKMAEKATACYRGEDPPVAAPPFSLKTGRAKFIRSGNTPGHRGARLTTAEQKGTAQGEYRGHELHRPTPRQLLVPRR